MFSSFEEYLLEFSSFDGRDPRVNKGLEVDFIPRFSQDVSGFVKQKEWDILLLSVHELGDGLDIEDKSLPQDKESSEERWVQYMDRQKEALQNDLIPFDVLTHPIRLGRGTRVTPWNIDELLIELAKVAKTEDKALELNGNDIMRDYVLAKKLAKACSVSGCKVSFGSDAHHPGEVGRGYKEAIDLVNRFDLKQRNAGS